MPTYLEIYDRKPITRQMQPALVELRSFEDLSEEERDRLLKDRLDLEFKKARAILNFFGLFPTAFLIF